jgi:rubrerythrin
VVPDVAPTERLRTMWYCTKCGKGIRHGDDKGCPECGAD